ncbi:MAG: bestrophin [Moraxellaceae bacterium]|nr:MAG: bestrophin [Moraxellaceae bacterium]
MIVRERPNSLRLLLAWQGSILPQILPQLVCVIALSAFLLLLNQQTLHVLPDVPITAFSLIGLTLSIFLGFRNNACYERWWEARKLWGNLIAQVRHLDRDSQLLPEAQRQLLMQYILAFSRVLHARLRQTSLASILPELSKSLNPSELHRIEQHANPAHYVLNRAHQVLWTSLKQAELSDICYAQLNTHLIELANVQAGCERILSTPLPFAYSLLLHRTAYLFCLLLPFALVHSLGYFSPVVVGLLAYSFFGLDALGNELEEPFGTQSNDLPLDALLRTIEIDILSGLNAADIPAPLQPQKHVLT